MRTAANNSNNFSRAKRQAVEAVDFQTFALRLLLWGAVAVAVLMASRARAHEVDELKIGTPVYGGTGCPAGTTRLRLDREDGTLGVLFDDFVAVAGGETGKKIDRKACNVAIPVHVPAGLSVSLIKVDYNGFTEVPRGALARFGVEYFFAGSQGDRLTRNFRHSNDEFIVSDEIATQVWSECGTDVLLRVNANMTVTTNADQDLVIAGIDSAKASTGFFYRLAFRSCN